MSQYDIDLASSSQPSAQGLQPEASQLHKLVSTTIWQFQASTQGLQFQGSHLHQLVSTTIWQFQASAVHKDCNFKAHTSLAVVSQTSAQALQPQGSSTRLLPSSAPACDCGNLLAVKYRQLSPKAHTCMSWSAAWQVEAASCRASASMASPTALKLMIWFSTFLLLSSTSASAELTVSSLLGSVLLSPT